MQLLKGFAIVCSFCFEVYGSFEQISVEDYKIEKKTSSRLFSFEVYPFQHCSYNRTFLDKFCSVRKEIGNGIYRTSPDKAVPIAHLFECPYLDSILVSCPPVQSDQSFYSPKKSIS